MGSASYTAQSGVNSVDERYGFASREETWHRKPTIVKKTAMTRLTRTKAKNFFDIVIPVQELEVSLKRGSWKEKALEVSLNMKLALLVECYLHIKMVFCKEKDGEKISCTAFFLGGQLTQISLSERG